MPVQATILGRKSTFLLSKYEKERGFVLSDSTNQEITVASELSLDDEFEGKELEVHLYSKKDIKENEIFQVFLKLSDTRIGWIFPAISLDSALHDFADNKHFLRYAYVGLRDALSILDDSHFTKNIEISSLPLSASDIFHEDTVFLVLSKDTYPKDFLFSPAKFTPSFIRHGYVELGTRDPGLATLLGESPAGAKFYIEQISEDIKSQDLIAELLNSSFAFEDNEIFKFFFLYQIFELLIDSVYKHCQEQLIDKLVLVKGDSGKTKDALSELSDFMSEKRRLALLFSKYTRLSANQERVRDIFNDLQSNLGRDRSSDLPGALYSIRNFIFHQYRDFPAAAHPFLRDVVEELTSQLSGILSNYTEK